MCDHETMMTDKTKGRLCLLSLFFLVCLQACTAYTTIKEKTAEAAKSLAFSGDGMIKKVAVLSPENKTFISEKDFNELFGQKFLETLDEECSDIILIKPKDKGYPSQLEKLVMQNSGMPDNLTFVKLGRELGLNAIVIVKAVEADAEEKEKGIPFFKDTHYFGILQINVVAYSMLTGAKIIDESPSSETEIDGSEFDAIRAGETQGIFEISEALSEMAANAGEKVCETIGEERWHGYIIAVDGERVRLSSGRETGLKPGDILNVYDQGERIQGKNKEVFLIPGEKIGEIKITEVFAGKGEAMKVSGGDIQPGCVVRPAE